MMKIYCKRDVSKTDSREYRLFTRDLLTKYIDLRKFTNEEFSLIIQLIQNESKISTHRGGKIKMIPYDEVFETSLSQLITDIYDFLEAPDFTHEADGSYVLDKVKFQMCEKWALKEKYLEHDGTWTRKPGRLGAFLNILLNHSVLRRPNRAKKLTVPKIDSYFKERYKLEDSIGDSFKASKAKKYYPEFSELKDLLIRSGRPI
ncbi:MAG: hypothetical protein SH819_08020 [Cytophagales bacterium]|nr:hypothetical protein [Cytophagales bacterium]